MEFSLPPSISSQDWMVGQHLMVLDIGERSRFERRNIPGSAYAVCDEAANKNIMPSSRKNIEIVLVGDDEEYIRQMAEMMAQIGLTEGLARRHKRVEIGFGGILLRRTYFLNRSQKMARLR